MAFLNFRVRLILCPVIKYTRWMLRIPAMLWLHRISHETVMCITCIIMNRFIRLIPWFLVFKQNLNVIDDETGASLFEVTERERRGVACYCWRGLHHPIVLHHQSWTLFSLIWRIVLFASTHNRWCVLVLFLNLKIRLYRLKIAYTKEAWFLAQSLRIEIYYKYNVVKERDLEIQIDFSVN